MVELAVTRRADLRTGLLAGAAVFCLLSRGDAVVVFALLACATAEWRSAGAVGLAGLAVLVRWHTSSLAALAGVQAVVGPAGVTGSFAAVLSSWAVAGALLLAAPTGWAAAPFGLAAGLVVAGPSGASLSGLLVRLVAAVAIVDLAVTATRWLPSGRRRSVALGLGAAAVPLAWMGRPSGGWHWAAVISMPSLALTALVGVVVVAVAGAVRAIVS